MIIFNSKLPSDVDQLVRLALYFNYAVGSARIQQNTTFDVVFDDLPLENTEHRTPPGEVWTA